MPRTKVFPSLLKAFLLKFMIPFLLNCLTPSLSFHPSVTALQPSSPVAPPYWRLTHSQLWEIRSMPPQLTKFCRHPWVKGALSECTAWVPQSSLKCESQNYSIQFIIITEFSVHMHLPQSLLHSSVRELKIGTLTLHCSRTGGQIAFSWKKCSN